MFFLLVNQSNIKFFYYYYHKRARQNKNIRQKWNHSKASQLAITTLSLSCLELLSCYYNSMGIQNTQNNLVLWLFLGFKRSPASTISYKALECFMFLHMFHVSACVHGHMLVVLLSS